MLISLCKAIHKTNLLHCKFLGSDCELKLHLWSQRMRYYPETDWYEFCDKNHHTHSVGNELKWLLVDAGYELKLFSPALLLQIAVQYSQGCHMYVKVSEFETVILHSNVHYNWNYWTTPPDENQFYNWQIISLSLSMR